MGSVGTVTSGCTIASPGSVAVGSGSSLSPSSAGAASSGTIPLGATELNNAGVSPLIGVPNPGVGVSISPMIGSSPTTIGSGAALGSAGTPTSGGLQPPPF